LRLAAVPFCIVLGAAATARAEQTIGATSIAVTTAGAAADACPDEKTFVAAVARMMHRDAVATVGRIVVTIHAEPDRVDGTITTEATERKLHGKQCHDVSEGLALVVALTIDPLADPSLPALVEPPPPIKEAPPPPPPPPRKPVVTRTAFYAAPIAGARMIWGIAPVDAIELLLGAQVGALRGRWAPSIRIDGGPLGTTSVQASGGTVVVSGGELDVTACPATFQTGSLVHVVVGGCLSGGATIVSTRSIGYTVEHDTTTPVGWIGVTLFFRARIAGPVGVFLDAGLRVPFEQLVWEVKDFGPIGSTSPVAGTAAIGLDFWVQ
jgi:hypothetical protein